MTTAKRPRRKPTTKTALQAARNAFAPDELFKLYKHAAMMLRAHAELDGVEGLQFLATPRGIRPIEEIPGAGRFAEANDGPLGHWMRTIREEGYASKSPAVRQALEERTNLAHTKGFKAHLRKIRKNKATSDQERALETGVDRHLALRDFVEGCDAVLDTMIRSKRDYRDIAVEWPKAWLNGVPIPVKK